MAELITDTGRKVIKKMAQVSQCARALSLMPTAEDFALRLIGDLRIITKMMNNISSRIDDILNRYSSIPSEFLLEGFDLILEKLDNISDYAKFTIAETTEVLSSTSKSIQEITSSVGNAVSATTSATLQIGGGLTYGAIAMSSNIKLAMTGNGRRAMTNDVVNDTVKGKVPITGMREEIEKRIDDKVGGMDDISNSIRDWVENSTDKSVGSIDSFFEGAGDGINKAVKWIDETKAGADKIVCFR